MLKTKDGWRVPDRQKPTDTRIFDDWDRDMAGRVLYSHGRSKEIDLVTMDRGGSVNNSGLVLAARIVSWTFLLSLKP